jgi:large subunit ribosomal protein L17
MRHLKSNSKKFHRTQEGRIQLKRDLVRGLILSGQIITFKERAKWVRPFFDRLVTLCKRADGDVQLQFKRVRPYLDEATARKFIEKILPKLKDRQGGYTRLLRYKKPFSDSEKAILSIVE